MGGEAHILVNCPIATFLKEKQHREMEKYPVLRNIWTAPVPKSVGPLHISEKENERISLPDPKNVTPQNKHQTVWL